MHYVLAVNRYRTRLAPKWISVLAKQNLGEEGQSWQKESTAVQAMPYYNSLTRITWRTCLTIIEQLSVTSLTNSKWDLGLRTLGPYP